MDPEKTQHRMLFRSSVS